MKQTILQFAIAAVFVSGLLLILDSTQNPPFEQAPDAQFTSLDGRVITLAGLRGKPVVINFWSTTCTVCLEEMPDLIALYEKYRPQGLEVLGITMPYDRPDSVIDMSRHKGITYPVIVDLMGEYSRSFGDVVATPTTFLIAPDGRVVYYRIGRFETQSLESLVTSFLANKEQNAG